MPPSLIRNADLCGESVVASRWTQMQAHVHAYAESWFIGTCWYAGVPAAPKALEKFSQWSLLFITKRHFFPAFRICLSLSLSLILPLFFFLHILLHLFFFFWSLCSLSTKNCFYLQQKIALILHSEYISGRRRTLTGYAVSKKGILKFLIYSLRLIT